MRAAGERPAALLACGGIAPVARGSRGWIQSSGPPFAFTPYLRRATRDNRALNYVRMRIASGGRSVPDEADPHALLAWLSGPPTKAVLFLSAPVDGVPELHPVSKLRTFLSGVDEAEIRV